MIFRKRTGPFPASLPIDQIPFLVFDTETTGLDPKKDRLLSVGAVRMKGGIIPVDQSFELIVEQGNTPVSGSAPPARLLKKKRWKPFWPCPKTRF